MTFSRKPDLRLKAVPEDAHRVVMLLLVDRGADVVARLLGLNKRTVYRVRDRRPIFPSTIERIRERAGLQRAAMQGG